MIIYAYQVAAVAALSSVLYVTVLQNSVRLRLCLFMGEVKCKQKCSTTITMMQFWIKKELLQSGQVSKVYADL